MPISFEDTLLEAVQDTIIKYAIGKGIDDTPKTVSNVFQNFKRMFIYPRLDTARVAYSTYSSILTTNSESFSREKCGPLNYYQALQIDVAVSGQCVLWSSSSMDTYGYLYQDRFDPVDPSTNRIISNDDGCDDGQFRLQYFLQKSTSYILVVTSYRENTTGPFSIRTWGGGNVSFIRMGKCICHGLLTR